MSVLRRLVRYHRHRLDEKRRELMRVWRPEIGR